MSNHQKQNKMKKKLFVLISAIACTFLFTSCNDEFEIRTMYQYQVGYDLSSVGGDAMLTTVAYFDQLQWNQVEMEDNDALSKAKAAEKNDNDALVEFEEKLGKYNEASLYARYAQSGVQSVKGKVTYTLTRLKNEYRDELVLRVKEIQINYDKQ